MDSHIQVGIVSIRARLGAQVVVIVAVFGRAAKGELSRPATCAVNSKLTDASDGQWRRRAKRTRSRQRRRSCCCKPPPSLGRCRCPAKNEAWRKREAHGAGTLIHALALARLVKPSPLAGRAVALVVFRQRGGAQQAQHADWRLRESDGLRDECPSVVSGGVTYSHRDKNTPPDRHRGDIQPSGSPALSVRPTLLFWLPACVRRRAPAPCWRLLVIQRMARYPRSRTLPARLRDLWPHPPGAGRCGYCSVWQQPRRSLCGVHGQHQVPPTSRVPQSQPPPMQASRKQRAWPPTGASPLVRSSMRRRWPPAAVRAPARPKESGSAAWFGRLLTV